MEVMQISLSSNSAEQTQSIAQKIGAQLRGGEVVELISDLGGGKTTFTAGLALGAGSPDHVASPTFTISRVYGAPNFDIHHFDLYRLQQAGLATNELGELIGDPTIVVVAEWADVVSSVLPERRVAIAIRRTPEETGRILELTYPEDMAYIVENVC